jgi:lysophospholipase L1-like esterase
MSLNVLSLGDSYTIGEGVSPEESWPFMLKARLAGEKISVGDIRVIARTGWTTGELIEATKEAGPIGPYGLVTLLAGVNNQYRGLGLEEYRKELGQLLDMAAGLADGHYDRVMVISIPDWGVTPFAADRDRKRIASEIDEFNRVAKEEALKRNAAFIDITEDYRAWGQDESMLAADGLHPSGKMYALWVDRIGKTVRALCIPDDAEYRSPPRKRNANS